MGEREDLNKLYRKHKARQAWSQRQAWPFKDTSFSEVKFHSRFCKGDTDGHQDVPTSGIRSRTSHHDETITVNFTFLKTSETTESAKGISPGLFGRTSSFALSVSESRQSSQPSNTSGTTTGVTVSDILVVTSQAASDKTKSQDLPCSSGHEAPVTHPTIPVSLFKFT